MTKNILNELKNDKNVIISKGVGNKNPYVNVCSYNKHLFKEEEYVQNIYKKIITAKKELCNELDTDVFTISINGYCIDGLNKSTSMLATMDSELVFLY